jgi:hypothetical protein
MEANTEPTTNPTPTQTIRNRSDAALDAVMLDSVVLQNDLRLYMRQAWHVVEPSTVYLEKRCCRGLAGGFDSHRMGPPAHQTIRNAREGNQVIDK